jgi:hypothetical protein
MPCRTEVIDEGPLYSRMLCYLCGKMEQGVSFNTALLGNPELLSWWKRHKEEDRERLKYEAKNEKVAAAKKRALEKLTPTERTLLGFNGEA